jgi:hypothetical protein
LNTDGNLLWHGWRNDDGAVVMVDVIDYPANRVKSDCLPEPGDKYEAYGLAHNFKPPSLHFVFPDWSMVCFPYGRSGMSSFKPLGDAGDCHGECVITLLFDAPGVGTMVIITGSNLHDFFWHYGQQQVRWVWALPEQFARAEEGAPVIYSIEIKEADRAALDAMLSDLSA